MSGDNEVVERADLVAVMNSTRGEYVQVTDADLDAGEAEANRNS
jgi:hypothetical protein